jgi:hypothetical protein
MEGLRTMVWSRSETIIRRAEASSFSIEALAKIAGRECWVFLLLGSLNEHGKQEKCAPRVFLTYPSVNQCQVLFHVKNEEEKVNMACACRNSGHHRQRLHDAVIWAHGQC